MAWLIVTVVPYGAAMVMVSAFVRGARLYWMCAGWMRLAIWGAEAICGIRYRVQGRENLPDGPVVLAPKHQSAWETLAFTIIMPRPLCFVFKRELLWVPFFGWAMSRLDMIHIDRSRRMAAWNKVAEQGARYLRQGNWVIMFPEGTRTPRGRQGVYKAGAAHLAITTSASLLPIAVTSARCWPRKAFIKKPGLIEVSIGKPIPSEGRLPDEMMREAEAWIEAEMRRLDPEAYSPIEAAHTEPARVS
ncbi:MAG TPA: lysophospholipid acyltransferase family protein [Burkholderiaceae bacterium]|nr:lysophospholipid acyltransferase family protein [Burkholderiaceae bacterium]